QGSRSRQAPTSESALAEEPMQTNSQMEEPSHLEFDTGADDQPIVQSSQHPEWFSQQHKPPSLDRDWNKTVPAIHRTQRDNDEFLKTVDENMKNVIKEQVKEQFKVQVSKILPRIKQALNEQLEAEVLTQSSHSSRASYVVAANLSDMELKKILIEKMEGTKSI
nr:hypothetical protein [Tanacetum cinerariifolium]